MITLYTREGCSKCDKAKQFLAEQQIEYEEKSIDRYKNYLLSKYPSLKELPVVFNDDELLGGYSELISFVGGNNHAGQQKAI